MLIDSDRASSCIVGIAFACSLAGCGGVASAPAGNAALGIAKFQVSETASQLVVIGLDDNKQEVARVELQRGPFTMQAAFAEDRTGAALNVTGRRLDIALGEERFHHESEGYAPLLLPLPPNAAEEFTPLITDGHVAPALARWGVQFKVAPLAAVSGEVAYDGTLSLYNESATAKQYVAGANCPQYWGSLGTNTCSSSGANSDGCGIGEGNYSGYSEVTDLLQCCNTGGGEIGPAWKTCVPTAQGATPCGTGGSVGCAVCWMLPGEYQRCNINLYGSSIMDIDYCMTAEGTCDVNSDCCNNQCCKCGTCQACNTQCY